MGKAPPSGRRSAGSRLLVRIPRREIFGLDRIGGPGRRLRAWRSVWIPERRLWVSGGRTAVWRQGRLARARRWRWHRGSSSLKANESTERDLLRLAMGRWWLPAAAVASQHVNLQPV